MLVAIQFESDQKDAGCSILLSRTSLCVCVCVCRLTDDVCSVLRLSKPLKEQYAKVPEALIRAS